MASTEKLDDDSDLPEKTSVCCRHTRCGQIQLTPIEESNVSMIKDPISSDTKIPLDFPKLSESTTTEESYMSDECVGDCNPPLLMRVESQVSLQTDYEDPPPLLDKSEHEIYPDLAPHEPGAMYDNLEPCCSGASRDMQGVAVFHEHRTHTHINDGPNPTIEANSTAAAGTEVAECEYELDICSTDESDATEDGTFVADLTHATHVEQLQVAAGGDQVKHCAEHVPQSKHDTSQLTHSITNMRGTNDTSVAYVLTAENAVQEPFERCYHEMTVSQNNNLNLAANDGSPQLIQSTTMSHKLSVGERSGRPPPKQSSQKYCANITNDLGFEGEYNSTKLYTEKNRNNAFPPTQKLKLIRQIAEGISSSRGASPQEVDGLSDSDRSGMQSSSHKQETREITQVTFKPKGVLIERWISSHQHRSTSDTHPIQHRGAFPNIPETTVTSTGDSPIKSSESKPINGNDSAGSVCEVNNDESADESSSVLPELAHEVSADHAVGMPSPLESYDEELSQIEEQRQEQQSQEVERYRASSCSTTASDDTIPYECALPRLPSPSPCFAVLSDSSSEHCRNWLAETLTVPHSVHSLDAEDVVDAEDYPPVPFSHSRNYIAAISKHVAETTKLSQHWPAASGRSDITRSSDITFPDTSHVTYTNCRPFETTSSGKEPHIKSSKTGFPDGVRRQPDEKDSPRRKPSLLLSGGKLLLPTNANMSSSNIRSSLPAPEIVQNLNCTPEVSKNLLSLSNPQPSQGIPPDAELPTPKESEIYICSICSYRFLEPTSFKLHLLTHPEVMNHQNTSVSAVASQEDEGGCGPGSCHRGLSCIECGAEFRSQLQLHVHRVINLRLGAVFCVMCLKPIPGCITPPAHLAKHTDTYSYLCLHCPRRFSLQALRDAHMTVHTPQYKTVELFFQCNICMYWFKSDRDLRKHIQAGCRGVDRSNQNFKTQMPPNEKQSTHDAASGTKNPKNNSDDKIKPRYYRCRKCMNSYVTPEALISHVQKYHEEPMPAPDCVYCEESHLSKGDMFQHMMAEHRDDYSRDNPFLCETCDARFKTMEAMEFHFQFFCKSLMQFVINVGVKRPYQCSLCAKEFFTIRTLKLHAVNHSVDNVCPSPESIESMLSHPGLALNAHQRESCELAVNRTVDSPSELNDKQSEEAVVGNGLKEMYTGRKYVADVVSGDRKVAVRSPPSIRARCRTPRPCPECGGIFRGAGALRTHQRTSHPGVKMYRCDMCSRRYSSSYSLVSHRRRHSGKVSFECEKCERQFSSRSSLFVHRKLHAAGWPYKCPVCSHVCRNLTSLNKHQLVHLGEANCELCGKQMASWASLKAHLRRHARQQSQQRPDDLQMTSKVKTLRLRKLSGVKRHHCPECPLTFFKVRCMKIHLKKKHKIN